MSVNHMILYQVFVYVTHRVGCRSLGGGIGVGIRLPPRAPLSLMIVLSNWNKRAIHYTSQVSSLQLHL